MEEIIKLWDEYIQTPYPPSAHIDGAELELLDDAIAGCIVTCIRNNGVLDARKIAILKQCLEELTEVEPVIPMDAKENFIKLRAISEKVLNLVRSR